MFEKGDEIYEAALYIPTSIQELIYNPKLNSVVRFIINFDLAELKQRNPSKIYAKAEIFLFL